MRETTPIMESIIEKSKLERFFAEAVKANAETIAEEFLALVKAAAADMGGSNGYSDGFSGNGIYTTFSPCCKHGVDISRVELFAEIYKTAYALAYKAGYEKGKEEKAKDEAYWQKRLEEEKAKDAEVGTNKREAGTSKDGKEVL